jgi:TonB family protein
VVVSQPVAAATSPATATSTMDAEAQKKAFEQAVAQKLQAEMTKLQQDYTQQLKQQQSKNAPVTTQASLSTAPQQRPQPAGERAAPSAAALDERRLAAEQRPPTPVPQPTQSAPQQQAAQPVPQPQQQAAAPPPVKAVREGDVVDVYELDGPVTPLSPIRPNYPPMAMRAKAQATVVLSTLVDENGRITDVKVLKGDPRFGFTEEAVRAVRATRFSTPMKDGKKVKTWRPQTISFAY